MLPVTKRSYQVFARLLQHTEAKMTADLGISVYATGTIALAPRAYHLPEDNKHTVRLEGDVEGILLTEIRNSFADFALPAVPLTAR